MPDPLPRSFYARSALVVARELLGAQLVRIEAGQPRVAGLIVETEAYSGADDLASHGRKRITPRNQPMYGQPGLTYVYLSRGIHPMLNVVAEPGDIPPVANIALKPLAGISATTVLGCTAASTDADGFVMSYQLQFSDGSQFSTPAALETFPAPGTYKATATVMDQFGASSSTSTTFSVGGATAPAAIPPSVPLQQQQQQVQKPLQPMRPPW